MKVSDYERNLERERARKDEFFAKYPSSPIPPEDRSKFNGLDYFPPDQNYRFEPALQEHQEKEVVRMAYTRGDEQEFIRWGEFRFSIHGREQTLQAYKSDPEEEKLFILNNSQTQ